MRFQDLAVEPAGDILPGNVQWRLCISNVIRAYFIVMAAPG